MPAESSNGTRNVANDTLAGGWRVLSEAEGALKATARDRGTPYRGGRLSKRSELARQCSRGARRSLISFAVAVFPAPKVPLSRMITGSASLASAGPPDYRWHGVGVHGATCRARQPRRESRDDAN